jgi:hypothetical protein
MFTTVSIKTGKYTVRYCAIEQTMAKKLATIQIQDSSLDKSIVEGHD